MNEIHAEGELVRAPNQVYVFCELIIGRIEIARIGRARANGETVARHRDAREALKQAINLNP